MHFLKPAAMHDVAGPIAVEALNQLFCPFPLASLQESWNGFSWKEPLKMIQSNSSAMSRKNLPPAGRKPHHGAHGMQMK